MIKALVTAYPDGIRCGCEDGLLPLHRYLHRPIVDLDALQLLLTYYPDAQLARSNRGQTPLHVALDHPSPDALAVELLVQSNPAALKVADAELYLPLHVCLDCAEVNNYYYYTLVCVYTFILPPLFLVYTHCVSINSRITPSLCSYCKPILQQLCTIRRMACSHCIYW